jgi:hypothetical protein
VDRLSGRSRRALRLSLRLIIRAADRSQSRPLDFHRRRRAPTPCVPCIHQKAPWPADANAPPDRAASCDKEPDLTGIARTVVLVPPPTDKQRQTILRVITMLDSCGSSHTLPAFHMAEAIWKPTAKKRPTLAFTSAKPVPNVAECANSRCRRRIEDCLPYVTS